MKISATSVCILFLAFFLTSSICCAQLFNSPKPITKINVLPQMIAHADLDGDGLQDIVGYSKNQIRVMHNLGTGVFDNKLGYTSSADDDFIDIRILDFNADGFPDVLCYTSTSVKVFNNNGDLTFSLATSFNRTLSGVDRIEVIDVNNDGYDDLVIYTLTSFDLHVNNQGISYGTGQSYDLAETFTGPFLNINRLGVADFNSDGLSDVATISRTQVLLFLNNGESGFGPPDLGMSITASGSQGNRLTNLAVADFNLDGQPDIAYLVAQIANYSDWGLSSVYMLTNNGLNEEGTVQFSQALLLSDNSPQLNRELLVGDATGNQFPDIVVTGHLIADDLFYEGDCCKYGAHNAIRLITNNGAMSVSDEYLLFEDLKDSDPLPMVTNHGVMTDLDGDGLAELIFPALRAKTPDSDLDPINYPGVPYYFQNTGGFQNFRESARELSPKKSENVVDWFIPRSSGSHTTSVMTHSITLHKDVVLLYSRNDNNDFEPALQLIMPKVKNRSFQSINVNNDTLPDLLVTVESTPVNELGEAQMIAVYTGNAQGGFDLAFSDSPNIIGELSMAAVDDLNGDGFDDIVAVSESNGRVVTLMNNLGQGFAASVIHQFSNNYKARSMKFFRASPEDNPDFILLGGSGNLGFYTPATIERFQNIDGQLLAPVSLNIESEYGSAHRLEVADVNGDGIPDFMVGGGAGPPYYYESAYLLESAKIGIWKSNGSGDYSSTAVVQKHRKDFFSMADVNGNGDPDFVYVSDINYAFGGVTVPNPGSIHLHVNNGEGTFETEFYILSEDETVGLSDGFKLAFFTQDSLPDLLGLSRDSETGLQDLYYMRNNISSACSSYKPTQLTSQVQSDQMLFSWSTFSEFEQCSLYVAEASNISDTLISLAIESSNPVNVAVPLSSFMPNSTYLWRVQCFCEDNVPGAWSKVSEFILGDGIGQDTQLEVEVYPNPSTSIVNVVQPKGDFSMQVYDLTGRMLHQDYAEGPYLQIPEGKLPKGVYLLHFEHSGQQIVRRLIIP